MTAILTTLFRGMVNVAIVTLAVAVIWSVYLYREPITSTIEPATRLFKSSPQEPARSAATVPILKPAQVGVADTSTGVADTSTGVADTSTGVTDTSTTTAPAPPGNATTD